MSTKLGTNVQTATTTTATPIPGDAQHVPIPSTTTQGQIDDLSKAVKAIPAGAAFTGVTANDTPTIDITGLGTAASPFTADAKLSTTANNALIADANGLFVSSVPALSTDVKNSLKVGTDGKLFNDISGSLIDAQIYRNTTEGLIDFTKPVSFTDQGDNAWEFIFPTEDIVLPTIPVGYKYVTATDAHFRLYNGDGLITERLGFKFNIVMSNGLSKNNDDDSQIDTFLEKNAIPNLDFSWTTHHYATPATLAGGSLKPFVKIKVTCPIAAPRPNNLKISEISVSTHVFLMKDLAFRVIVGTDIKGN
jgi:hypothetical protein